MILGTVKPYLLGAILVGLAGPSLAAEPARAPAPEAKPMASAGGTDRSRRVELPFLLDSGSPDRGPPPPARGRDDGPHPFRELLLKRASLASPPVAPPIRLAFGGNGGYLSPSGEFG